MKRKKTKGFKKVNGRLVHYSPFSSNHHPYAYPYGSWNVPFDSFRPSRETTCYGTFKSCMKVCDQELGTRAPADPEERRKKARKYGRCTSTCTTDYMFC